MVVKKKITGTMAESRESREALAVGCMHSRRSTLVELIWDSAISVTAKRWVSLAAPGILSISEVPYSVDKMR